MFYQVSRHYLVHQNSSKICSFMNILLLMLFSYECGLLLSKWLLLINAIHQTTFTACSCSIHTVSPLHSLNHQWTYATRFLHEHHQGTLMNDADVYDKVTFCSAAYRFSTTSYKLVHFPLFELTSLDAGGEVRGNSTAHFHYSSSLSSNLPFHTILLSSFYCRSCRWTRESRVRNQRLQHNSTVSVLPTTWSTCPTFL